MLIHISANDQRLSKFYIYIILSVMLYFTNSSKKQTGFVGVAIYLFIYEHLFRYYRTEP